MSKQVTTILRLKTGDRMRDSDGRRGTVVRFLRNFVMIEWGDGKESPYADVDLKAYGVEKVSPFDDAEDTVP